VREGRGGGGEGKSGGGDKWGGEEWEGEALYLLLTSMFEHLMSLCRKLLE